MKIIYCVDIINIELTSNITSEKDNLKLNISFKYRLYKILQEYETCNTTTKTH